MISISFSKISYCQEVDYEKSNTEGFNIDALPIEVIANNLFKFFDFKYWIKSLVPVCKKWQQAAVQSQLDKLICLNLSKPETVFNAHYIINHYRIVALVLLHPGTSVYHLASIINASPKLKTVAFKPPITSFTSFSFLAGKFPEIEDKETDPKVYFNHVTTVGVPYRHSSLLCMFPNAEKISIGGDFTSWHELEYSSPRVKEIEISSVATDIDEALELFEVLKSKLPNLAKVYLTIQDDDESLCKTIKEVGKTIGLEVICRCVKPGSHLTLVDHLPWLCDNNESFAQTLGPIIQWQKRDKESIDKYYDLQTLPFWMSVEVQTRRFDNGKQIAMETLKNAKIHELMSFRENVFLHSCARVMAILSPQSIANEVGQDALRIMLNGRSKTNETVLYHLIEEYDELLYFDIDIVQFEDLLETETLKALYVDIIAGWRAEKLGDILSVIHQLDAMLKKREGDNVRALPIVFIFQLFSEKQFDKIRPIVELFNIDLNQSYNIKGQTLLTHAIEEGHYTLIDKAITLGIDVNKPDKNGISPLIKAIQHKYQAAVEILLRNGADPNIAGDSALPLNLALSESDEKSFRIMNTLLSFGADINKKSLDKKGRFIYPILVAVQSQKKNVEKVKQLILRGADPKVENEAGSNLLHMAVLSQEENKDLISLLGKYVDVNHANKLGRTPLHHAVMNRSKSIGALINIGADPNRQDIFGRTSLMMAMAFNCPNLCLHPLLSTNKLDIKARDKNGQSFVSYIALNHSSWDNIQSLFKSEQIINACQYYLTEDNIQFVINECKAIISQYKDLSKVFTIIACHVTLAKFFVERIGLDVNHSDILGNTLLSCMNVNGDESCRVVEYLVSKGAKLDQEQDPLLLHELLKTPSLTWHVVEKMKLLAKHGALVSAKNTNGLSLVDIDPLFGHSLDLHPDCFDHMPDLP